MSVTGVFNSRTFFVVPLGLTKLVPLGQLDYRATTYQEISRGHQLVLEIFVGKKHAELQL